jgi:hypothetical protein
MPARNSQQRVARERATLAAMATVPRDMPALLKEWGVALDWQTLATEASHNPVTSNPGALLNLFLAVGTLHALASDTLSNPARAEIAGTAYRLLTATMQHLAGNDAEPTRKA